MASAMPRQPGYNARVTRKLPPNQTSQEGVNPLFSTENRQFLTRWGDQATRTSGFDWSSYGKCVLPFRPISVQERRDFSAQTDMHTGQYIFGEHSRLLNYSCEVYFPMRMHRDTQTENAPVSSSKSSHTSRHADADPAETKRDNDHQRKRPRSPELSDKENRPATKKDSSHGTQSRSHRQKVVCPPARPPIYRQSSSTQQKKEPSRPDTIVASLPVQSPYTPPPAVDQISPAPRQKSTVKPASQAMQLSPVKSASFEASEAWTEPKKQRVAHKASSDILHLRRSAFNIDDKKSAAKTTSSKKLLHSEMKVARKSDQRRLDQKLCQTIRRIRKL